MNCFTEYLSSLTRKDEVRKTKYEGKPSDEIFSAVNEFTLEECSVVTKKNEDLVVLNLSDVHFTDYKDIMHTAPKRSFPTPLTVTRLIKAVKPDLITITGDIVCGRSTVYSIRNFSELLERFGIPWAPVFGNHDKEGNCDLNYLADVMMSYPHCLMKKGDARMGVGNYVVAVKDKNGKISDALIMTDSNRYNDGESEKVRNEWFKWVTDGIKMLSPEAECSVFLHIPIAEYVYAYEQNYDEKLKKWKSEKFIGHIGEKICPHENKAGLPLQTGFFEAIKNSGNTKNVFCGHDHLNAFSTAYEGVRLNYVMKISKSAGRKPGYDGGLKIVFRTDGKTELDYKTVSYGPMKSSYKIIY